MQWAAHRGPVAGDAVLLAEEAKSLGRHAELAVLLNCDRVAHFRVENYAQPAGRAYCKAQGAVPKALLISNAPDRSKNWGFEVMTPVVLALATLVVIVDGHGGLTLPPPRNNHGNVALSNFTVQPGSQIPFWQAHLHTRQ